MVGPVGVGVLHDLDEQVGILRAVSIVVVHPKGLEGLEHLSQRDPGAARDSFAFFSQLLARYPASQYAPDAKLRMIYLRNLLARYEVHVANYYFKRGAYLAAANRGRYVVENFQQTPAVPDALAVMVQAYELMELPDLAADTLITLRANYPQHSAIDEQGNFVDRFSTKQEKPSWVNRLSLGFLDRPQPPVFDSRTGDKIE